MAAHKLTHGMVSNVLKATDVAIFTETHEVSSQSANLQSASMPAAFAQSFHCVRAGPFVGRGGVSMHVRAGLVNHVQLVGIRQAPGFESVWIRLSHNALLGEVCNGKDLLIGAVYASPSTSNEYRRGAAGNVEGGFVHELQLALDQLRMPTDYVVLAGDFNARIAGLDDVPSASTLELFGELEQLGVTMPVASDFVGIPVRHSADTKSNASGRALCTFAQHNGVVVLNGREGGSSPGKLTCIPPPSSRSSQGEGAEAGSMIDLFLSDPSLLRALHHISVFGPPEAKVRSGSSVTKPISDHRLVCMQLNILGHNAVAGEDPRPRPQPLRFDEGAWRKYLPCFSESARAALQANSDMLVAGLRDSASACEHMSSIVRSCFSALKRALRAPPVPNMAHAGQQRSAKPGKPWWNTHCSAAYSAMRVFANNHGRGARQNLPAEEHSILAAWRVEFEALRAAFRRACKEAKQEYNAALAESWVQESRKDPWHVFRLLTATPFSQCALSATAWGQHGQRLHAADPGAPTAEEPKAHRILNLINASPSNSWSALEEVPCLRDAWLGSEPVAARRADAGSLNDPITLEEVVWALGRMHFNKAAGPDRLPGEAWRCAREPHATDPAKAGPSILAPHVHLLFSRVFAGKDFPRQFRVSKHGPIFKKGDKLDPDCYRGIAVGNVLGKAYNAIISRRLSRWAARHKYRHGGQAGFMEGLGTSHHHYIMRHLATRYSTRPPTAGSGRRCGPGLLVCQIDFSKAFDKVPHGLLWERLQERGVHGHILDTLKSCYDEVWLQPTVNGEAGDPFLCEQGVKQGDPASPTLFGFYIEVLADFVDAMDAKDMPIRCPRSGQLLRPCKEDTPLVGGIPDTKQLVTLLFADDVNLLALSAERMNYLLALLEYFCEAFGMKVNINKCELLAFHYVAAKRRELLRQPVLYKGEQLRIADRAKYLGLWYGPPVGHGLPSKSLFTNSWLELLAAGKAATGMLTARLAAAGLHIPHTMLVFYNTCVRPILCFGAQVWSSSYLTLDFDTAMQHPIMGEQRLFLRRVLGAQRVSNQVLYAELSQLPMQHHWSGLVCRFWNTLVKKCNTLYHDVFRSDIRMALERQVGWAHEVIAFLRSLQLPNDTLKLPDHAACSHAELIDAYCNLKLPVQQVQEHVAERLRSVWSSADLVSADPRTYVGLAPSKVCRHVCWMGAPECKQGSGTLLPIAHTKLAMAREKHMCLMRFRAGVWDLEINKAYGGARPRAERVCRLCVQARRGEHVEDEKHVATECAAHQQVRNAFPSLPFSLGIHSLMAHADQKLLADYLCKLKDSFESQHDTCVDRLECSTCGCADNERDMLLCDGNCCRGFHLGCLVPPQPRPKAHEAWFCPDCAARLFG